MRSAKTVQLRSLDLIRALIGPTPDKVMSARKLAQRTKTHHSFISHLVTGRRTTCSADLAQRIAAALGMKPSVLFRPAPSTTAQTLPKRQVVR